MISIFKFPLTAITTILLLSITIKERTIFSHIYSTISPFTVTTQKAATKLAISSYQSASSYIEKLFKNSVPQAKDSITSKLSAPSKNPPQENILLDEKKELNDLIKNRR